MEPRTETFEVVVVHPSYHRRRYWAQRIGKKITDLVGGASLYDGTGLWKNGDTVEFEPHILVKTYCNGMNASEVFSALSLLLKEYKVSTEQDVVLVVLNGEPMFLAE